MPAKLVEILEILEKAYGRQKLAGPSDPYQMIVFLNCGYPASDRACAKGFDTLKREVGVEPNQLLAVSRARLAKLMRPSAIVPAVCAERLKEVAGRVKNEFAKDLTAALKRQIEEAKGRSRERFEREPSQGREETASAISHHRGAQRGKDFAVFRA